MPKRLTVRRPSDFREFERSAVNQCIQHRISDTARHFPDRVAIRAGNRAWTYPQLDGFANCLADAILSRTDGALRQCAILLPSTPLTIISMLGSLKAHKAYVPLDAHFPVERLQTMLHDSDPCMVLTDSAHLQLADELVQGRVPILDVSSLKLEEDATEPSRIGNPLDRAYILYTSGSTGRPKGIEFLHRNLLHTTMCLTNELFYSASDRVTWLHSPTFGSSVVDIYCCLANGGTLLPWDVKSQGFNGLADWLQRERATTLQWIPSAFRQFARTLSSETRFSDVRIVVMAGEPLLAREADVFRRHFAVGSHLVNQVGTGESYNYCLYRVDHDLPLDGANVPGGYPVSVDREVLILDDDLRPVACGKDGQIAIRSDYMAAGYWRDPKLTGEKFVRLLGDPRPTYLTGDVGLIDEDGCLMHMGRRDSQIKIRGCRVEVAEVEDVLGRVPGVSDCAVWIAPNRAGEDQLVAYVVPEHAASVDEALATRTIAAKLPDYMVPSHFCFLDELPALPTGKVNRRGLPNPLVTAAGREISTELTGSDIEVEMCRLFAELLQIPGAGPGTDFVREGGDSLMAAVLAERVFRLFGVGVDFQSFMQGRTAAHLAGLVKAALQTRAEKHPVPVGAMARQSAVVRADRHKAIRVTMPGSHSRTAAHLRPGRSVGNLIIIGAGQCGREIFTWAEQAIAAGAPWRIKGFLDTRTSVLDGYDYPVPIITGPNDYRVMENDVFVGAFGDPRDKVRYLDHVIRQGGEFVNIIHPRANVGHNVRFGVGVVLAPFASVTSDVTIGSHVSIGAFSNLAHDTIVGDWTQISSHCGLNGQATLAEGVFLGSHACVIPRVDVGAWAYIGAGSVVVRDVPEATKVFGNPAAIIRIMERPDQCMPYGGTRPY